MSGRPYRSLRIPEEVWAAARAEVGRDGNVTALLLSRLIQPPCTCQKKKEGEGS